MALTTNAWQCDTSLSYNTTYFWKVRGINNNSHSAWSGVGTFTTMLLPAVPQPPLASSKPSLLNPRTGSQGVGVRPVFEWGSLSGTERFELLVSTGSGFNDVVIARIGVGAVPGTIWQSDIELPYGTNFYWKVRGVSGSIAGMRSDVNSFTTILPVPAAPPRRSKSLSSWNTRGLAPREFR